MADEEDHELAYLRRQRANLEAREEIDRREYEHLQKRKQMGSGSITIPREHAAGPLKPPGAAEPARRTEKRPVATSSAPLISDTLNGQRVNLMSPEPNGMPPDQTIDGATRQGVRDHRGQHSGRSRYSNPHAAAPPPPASASKRRRTDSGSGHSSKRATVIPRKTPSSSLAERRPINSSFPTVARTSDGGLAEFRCNFIGCLATGFWKNGSFQFFKGIAGLGKHYNNTATHPNLTEREVSIQCLYHKLNDQQSAVVLAGDTEGYKIEQVWLANTSNTQQSAAAMKRNRHGREKSQDSTLSEPSHHTEEGDLVDREEYSPAPEEEVDDDAAVFQVLRREYFTKKLENTATADDDREFLLLEAEEKARLQDLPDLPVTHTHEPSMQDNEGEEEHDADEDIVLKIES